MGGDGCGDRSGGGKRVADFTLAHWTRLLASLGRRETLAGLFAETYDRVLDGGPLQEIFFATQEGYKTMVSDPGISYRCGSLAVLNVGRSLGKPEVDLRVVIEARSSENGFSVGDLLGLCAQAGLPLVAAQRPAGDESLVIPSVIHWRQNHYAAVLDAKGDYVRVKDPTFGHPRWLHTKVVNA